MTSTTTPVSTGSGLLRAFQVFAALSVLSVLVQFITAGQLFPDGGPEELHAGGAIVLHVLSGLAAIAAFLLWRRDELSRGSMALAVVTFAYSFLQAAWGGRSSLWIHVPGAMVMSALVVWVLVAALRVGRRTTV